MDPLWGTQLTDMWMNDPYMFDPTQKSNQFSQFNNQALPFPPTYNDANGVTNALGQPIQSYVDWKNANPGGQTINNTAAQPQPQQGISGQQAALNYMLTQNAVNQINAAGLARNTGTFGSANYAQEADGTANQLARSLAAQKAAVLPYYQQAARSGGSALDVIRQMQGAWGQLPSSSGGGASGVVAATPGGVSTGTPNNYYAALNALANPGPLPKYGAQVPASSGFQPAGGINQAFLDSRQSGPQNQNFLSALGALQGRRQT